MSAKPVPMLNRRRFLAGTAGFAVAGLALDPAAAKSLSGMETAALRGSISATDLGVEPGALDDQSRIFAKMLQKASDTGMPVFLPPGTYVVSNLTLPRQVRLAGAPGATRIVYGGDGHLLLGDDTEYVELTGLVLDGANRWIGDQSEGLVYLRRAAHVAIDNCQVLGSAKNGIVLENAAGRIERTAVSGAADAGIWSIDGAGMAISGNTVSDCANGGILIRRWQPGEDGTLVTGNRVQRILAANGGTGQNGNGINAFRANNVIISGNMVSDCAFSSVRANSASNVQISNNTCMRSGETAIYSEFSFEGAAITGNIVDGAANGISIVNFNEGGRIATCAGNIVRNMTTVGPYAADSPGFGTGICFEADTAATGNVVENAPLYGFQIGWGPFMRNVVATGNVIRRAGTGIAISVVEGSGSAILTDNVIDGAERGAIFGQRWAEPVTGDLASVGTQGYANLTVERNQVS